MTPNFEGSTPQFEDATPNYECERVISMHLTLRKTKLGKTALTAYVMVLWANETIFEAYEGKIKWNKP